MGVQITIKATDMVAAGWTVTHTVQPDREVDLGEGGYPETIQGDAWSTWTRPSDGAEVRAYYLPSGDFFADCRSGGSNEELFERLGLLKLPHSLW